MFPCKKKKIHVTEKNGMHFEAGGYLNEQPLSFA
jgi:hypothetical protein